MVGTVVMIVILVLSPVVVSMGATIVAVALGWSLNREVDAQHEGSEQLALAYPDAD